MLTALNEIEDDNFKFTAQNASDSYLALLGREVVSLQLMIADLMGTMMTVKYVHHMI